MQVFSICLRPARPALFPLLPLLLVLYIFLLKKKERQERLHTLLNVPSLSVEPLPWAPCLLWKYIRPDTP